MTPIPARTVTAEVSVVRFAMYPHPAYDAFPSLLGHLFAVAISRTPHFATFQYHGVPWSASIRA